MKFVNQYSEIKKISVRGIVRNLALDVFSAAAREYNLYSTERVQFIYLHHVFSDEEKALRKLLNFLAKEHTFISYSSAVDCIVQNKIDKPYISFSTDDGFKNNISAAKIFNEYGVKACFFICPDIIGETKYNVIQKFCNQRLHLPAIEFLNWNDVSFLQKQGHEIGSHTLSHVNLACSGRAMEEIAGSKDKLQSRVGKVNHFAYPYGRYAHFNRSLFDSVFKAGYSSCASAERGCHVNGERNEEMPLIRRDQVILNWKLCHIQYFLMRNIRKDALKAYLPPF